MDKVTDDEEIIKLLDVKDIEFIETSELLENVENDKNSENTKLMSETNGMNNSDDSDANQKSNGNVIICTERRSDEPTELSFEKGTNQICQSNQKIKVNDKYNNNWMTWIPMRLFTNMCRNEWIIN